MGEQADYVINDMADSFIGSGGGRHKRRGLIKTCARCGEGDLRWMNVKGGDWRLHTPQGQLHACRPVVEMLRG